MEHRIDNISFLVSMSVVACNPGSQEQRDETAGHGPFWRAGDERPAGSAGGSPPVGPPLGTPPSALRLFADGAEGAPVVANELVVQRCEEYAQWCDHCDQCDSKFIGLSCTRYLAYIQSHRAECFPQWDELLSCLSTLSCEASINDCFPTTLCQRNRCADLAVCQTQPGAALP